MTNAIIRNPLFTEFDQLFSQYVNQTQAPISRNTALNYRILSEDNAAVAEIEVPGVEPSEVKVKIEGQLFPVNRQVLTPEMVQQAAYGLMTAEQVAYFERELEIDFAISEPGLGRFRVALFHQRGYPAIVLRYITAEIPRLETLGLPPLLGDLVLHKRGLVLMVGAAGSGKSTTLAAMVNHRNETSPDHILTIEDPIEFLHTNKKSIVNQREVGLDTKSFGRALRGNTPVGQHYHLIGDGESFIQVVRDDDAGQAQGVVQLANQARRRAQRDGV
jgi:Tfp pilus assembly ATPase PilU